MTESKKNCQGEKQARNNQKHQGGNAMSTSVIKDEKTLSEVIDSVLEHVSIDMQGECNEKMVTVQSLPFIKGG